MSDEIDQKSINHYTDGIKLYSGVVVPEFCEGLIDLFENNVGQQQEQRSPGYSFTELNLSMHWSGIAGKLADLFKGVATQYGANTGFYEFWPQFDLAPIRMKRYLPERDDGFRLHTDVHDLRTAPRFLAMFAYLNEVTEGGETTFPHWDASIKPIKGSVLAFPPWLPYVHGANPPVSGPKYMVGSYALYR